MGQTRQKTRFGISSPPLLLLLFRQSRRGILNLDFRRRWRFQSSSLLLPRPICSLVCYFLWLLLGADRETRAQTSRKNMPSAGVAVSLIHGDSFVLPPPFIPPPSDDSILIYVSLAGSLIPLRVLESDSIESVKLRIQTSQGFVVKKQRLVCGGRVLSRNDSLVKDYGVSDGNVLHLVLRLSDFQVICVTTACGKEYAFHVDKDRDVGYVKQQIARKSKGYANPDEQEVVCNGERLDDQRLIDDISRQNGAVLHLLVRKSAKIRARPVDKNFELSIVASELAGRRRYDRSAGDEPTSFHERDDHNREDYKVRVDTIPVKVLKRNSWVEPVVINPKIELSSFVWDMINSTVEGLERGFRPIRSVEGTGGAYFLQDSSGQRYISVFKPMDEEPMAENNPHGLPMSIDGVGLKKGTKVGEGAFREVAAYLLDHPRSGRRSLFGDEEGFSGVPPTVLIKCLHEGFNHPVDVKVKIGSLQMYVESQGSCEDMGPGAFPVNEVHKISLLDIRLANADRHAGNILLRKDGSGQSALIPIDHGYCLPECFEDCTFDWLYWPQAQVPYSLETIDYIASLDAEEDIALLKFHGWDLPIECARTLRISTMLLKKGVKRGFTPFRIGSIMCRETLNQMSLIEEVVQEAEDSMLPDSSESAFLDAVSQVMDIRLDEITENCA